MNQSPSLHLDLTNPAEARRFVRGLRMPDGTKVTKIRTEDGAWHELATTPDSLITKFASQLYDCYINRENGFYFEEELMH